MTKKFEYYSLLKQVNEEQISIFDDVMHRNQLYLDTPICLFFIRGVGIGIFFTLKLIIQGLL
jgi:hypothetical protein